MAAARPRSRCDVRCEALQQLSLPVDIERSRRPLRSRAPSVERLARSRELAHAAELDRRRCPRIRALVERQVPASWRTSDARLSAADDWRSAVGVRGPDTVSRLRACRAERHLEWVLLQRAARTDSRVSLQPAWAALASAGRHDDRRAVAVLRARTVDGLPSRHRLLR